MTRPKGSKNKVKVPEHAVAKGNTDFNLTGVTPSHTITAAPVLDAVGAITPEDLDLERHLEQLDRESVVPDIDPDLSRPLTLEKVSQDHLREHVDNYRAASTINELEEQIHVAKSLRCDSIDATPQLIKRFSQGKDNGMFINVKDIRVNYPDMYSKGKQSDRMTQEQRLFGDKKA